MFFQAKCCILASVITAKGFASTRFVKQSIATTRNLIYFLPGGKGPTMSTPHVENGRGDEMFVMCSARMCYTFPNH